jgi:hypothetical protein
LLHLTVMSHACIMCQQKAASELYTGEDAEHTQSAPVPPCWGRVVVGNTGRGQHHSTVGKCPYIRHHTPPKPQGPHSTRARLYMSCVGTCASVCSWQRDCRFVVARAMQPRNAGPSVGQSVSQHMPLGSTVLLAVYRGQQAGALVRNRAPTLP